MKYTLYILLAVCAGCTAPAVQQDTGAGKDSTIGTMLIKKSSYYAQADPMIIITAHQDSIIYTKKEFDEIVDNYPELYSDFPQTPDISYYGSSVFKEVPDSLGHISHNLFSSEVGQDTYYTLYAYFLKIKNGEAKYAVRRKNLIGIYEQLNSLFGSLDYGGTYYGHQYQRIEGYAEYSIYWYSTREDFFIKPYNISKQKELYLASLRQLISDEESIDPNTAGKTERSAIKKSLLETVDKLDSLITDNFYLKMAQEFQYSHY